ncbi:1-phosphatidylinositol-3-phosphate 5-kinase FAB1A-like [Phalaenopsis equestris]|uniref:1-phosphatidylinositol-3-phosphate 5-kinase FAB1A-like n=1 Tax=Phalaenopsis equestris TaxID=78828 RepID=UPI0009E28726|nr:1-phosphatidylinositol-3-phosphate 5-kinase FAB1A-like [Phalaenopsis equestris]XP_020573340.1 1-phosphatidylinositol-3-phosphate 5-kinase FAB1A-like [Phalaenopsis equestris]XP_020573341.1 1-phosphatidylinositol-3-phosphate 5-kinase FAB1A-like [Phalaenopsis equestris]
MHACWETMEQAEELGKGSSFQKAAIESSHVSNGLNRTRVLLLEENSPSSLLGYENYDDNSVECVDCYNVSPEPAQSEVVDNDANNIKDAYNGSKPSYCVSIEADPLIWLPPEPEDISNVTDSVTNVVDGDKDYNDDTRWGQLSSLSNLDEEQGNIVNHKDEHQKLMMEVINGQLKLLVSRCLASEGIRFVDDDSCQNWLNIVTSLSWEAALLVKPDDGEGRAMDPCSYVKVKCIASGSRSQSQVIKGLVFKKSAAHKHMPTSFKNARLLLLKGFLGNSANGLSSFESMGKEKDHLKFTIDMIENFHPNVILVEKTVSRDVQEAVFSMGITLVFDMKLPRLERIALCTGSQIFSLHEMTVRQNLMHCDSFHFEKLVDEHNSIGDAGKKLAKTLMFLEGFPRPLGCTILLKGANSDELKKIKHALQYTVFAAYHLKIETSFFADQKAFFSSMSCSREDKVISVDQMVTTVNSIDSLNSNLMDHKDSLACAARVNVVDIPIFNVSMMKSFNEEQSNSNECAEGSLMLLGSNFESSRDNIMPRTDNGDILLGESLPALTLESISAYVELKETEHDNDSRAVFSPLVETLDYENFFSKDLHEKLGFDFHIGGEAGLVSDLTQITEIQIDENTEVKLKSKNDIEFTLDPESILVLASRQCIPKQIACEESRLTRIKYYGNLDVSLGRYLQDILLSQKYTCSSCGERSEAHIYRFTHQNGNLTATVRLLPKESILLGEAEGKIWMWTRCLKCDHDRRGPKASRRVTMSSVARGLSFGKFLDLSFADHSAANRLSRCGHLLHKDCLRFFGLGSKVAMFRYSSVEIYTACKPQPLLEFYNQNGEDWIRKEAKDVLEKVDLLYRDVANVLLYLKSYFASSIQKKSIKFSGPMKPIYELENMLKEDKTAFEASLEEAVSHGVHQGKNVNKIILDLNWLIEELILLLYVWDCRLHFLVQHLGDFSVDVRSVHLLQIPVIVGESYLADGNQHAGNYGILENELKIESARFSGELAPVSSDPLLLVEGNLLGEGFPELTSVEHSEMATERDVIGELSNLSLNDFKEESIPILDHVIDEESDPDSIVPFNYTEETRGPEQRTKESCSGNENPAAFQHNNSDAEDKKQWIWNPFSELRKAYRKDLHGGSLHKFQFISVYTPVHLSGVRKLITPKCSLHFAVGLGGNVLSLVDDEISSIISCALALYKDQCGLMDVINEKEANEKLDQATDASFRSHSSLALSRSHLESEASCSSLADDHYFSTSDASLFVDQLITSDNLHPEITLGYENISGKSKYSVICIYAREFFSLRKKCCPSELAYISSLNRCKKWDAQGGKSKVFFAKTMDDRFIIKQIKKTELDSFLKFGPQYFKYLFFSLDSGNQTCLAKILGIYQVRQFRNGKEVKTDLMVMENLLFGRNISCKYDLKGAIFSRYISNANDSDKILLDGNFIEDMRMSPIYVGKKTKHLLQRAIWNDTFFLTSINVMDYSLLVGVDREHRELVFGIIDYVRQYTWDKQLETWVKASLVVPKNALPTVISPKEYKKRFRKFMSKYFLTVPDTWSCTQYSGSDKSLLSNDACSPTLYDENDQDKPIEAFA